METPMHQTYDAQTNQHDQLVMLLWLGGFATTFASAFSYGLLFLGLI